MRPVMVLGHRGSPREHDENTIEGFEAALRDGADGVELDVRCDATGVAVVCHDPTLTRTAGADVRVRASSLAALRAWPFAGGGVVPSLQSVFRRLGSEAFVNVEIKHDDVDPARIADATARVIAAARPDGRRLVVSSFEPRALALFQHRAPRVPIGLLIPTHSLEAADVLARSRGLRISAVHPHHSICTPERVAMWHRCGLRVNTWTVDQPADIERVLAAGVDAIITNLPRACVALLATIGPAERGETARVEQRT